MVDGGMKCVKYLLFAFNLIFAISGIAILTAGAIIEGLFRSYSDFLVGNFFSPPVLLIVVGVIIFAVAFFGCCGAVKENHCMTVTFSVLLALIFILELAAGIAAFVLKDDVSQFAEDKMYSSLDKYNETNTKKTWDHMQHDLQCCGVNNYTDWWYNSTFFANSKNLPDSCCISSYDGCGNNTVDPFNASTYFPNGCLVAFEEKIVSNIVIVGGVALGIAFVQFLGIVFACCLAKSIKQQYEAV